MTDYGLELLLSYDGKRHYFASGHYLKFEIRIVEPSEQVPHGLGYSLTMHDPRGKRLLGFDNAHPVPHQGSKYIKAPAGSDHWHRTEDDKGRPYAFKDAAALLDDFFDAVELKIAKLDLPNEIVGENSDDTSS